MTSSSALTVTENAVELHPFSTAFIQDSEHIKVGERGSPAVVHEYKTFLQMVPLCLWLSCTQPHLSLIHI